MDYDEDKVDEAALALLYLTLGSDGRAWKGMDWGISDRLHAKGWIENPKNKNSSFELTQAGREACIALFKRHFVRPATGDDAPLFALPIDMGMLVMAHQNSRVGVEGETFYLDLATGGVYSSQWFEADEIIDPARYIPVPKRGEDDALWSEKRAKRRLTEWLASLGVCVK